MPLTLEDIARLSGVSRSTVSRVINTELHVNEETRQKVLKVIQNCNFQPNLAARGLVSGRTNVIGVVIPASASTFFTDPYFPLLLQGVSTVCNNQDFSVMLWLVEPDYERRMITRILHNGLVDGVIIASLPVNDPIVHSLIESKMHFVLIGRHPTEQVSYVDVDNVQAGRQATLHLANLGFKRIATITGPQNLVAGIDRYQGYLKGLHESDRPYQPELVIEGDFTEDGGYRCMKVLLPSRPDAVFVAGDSMAYGALRALNEEKIRVPGEIALVGFDDLPASSKTDPPLTTIRQPIVQMGRKAADLLIHLIQTKTDLAQATIMETELIIRESCGALK